MRYRQIGASWVDLVRSRGRPESTTQAPPWLKLSTILHDFLAGAGAACIGKEAVFLSRSSTSMETSSSLDSLPIRLIVFTREAAFLDALSMAR